MSGVDLQTVASAFVARKVVEVLGLTYRHRWAEGGERLRDLRETGQPAIISAWHNRILFASYYLRNALQRRGYPLIALVSRSRDGDVITRVARAWGAPAARGSSSRGGTRALRELARWLGQRRGGVVTTPDGPRGPVYRLRPGTVVLAQMTGVPIYPLSFAADRAWRLNSWDRFIVPQPFSRIATAVGEPIVVRRDLDAAGREAARIEIEAAMANTDREASAALQWAGRLDR